MARTSKAGMLIFGALIASLAMAPIATRAASNETSRAITIKGGVNATTPGAITFPAPTFNQLTVEWAITGDDNLNGVVAVRFKPQGNSDWRQAMALRRVPAGSNIGFSWGNRHSGSVFGLQPATTYDIELTLTDADGGNSQQLRQATTRAVPVPMAGALVRNATPSTLASVMSAAQAGDIIQLGAGNYPAFTIDKDGVAGAPLVFRGTPGATIAGELSLFFRSHVMLQNLTVNGRIRFNGSNDITITGCTINPISGNGGDGIVTFLRSERAYIADNIITGLTTWAESSLGASGNNLGEGIIVTGPGHVIARNTVRGFRDGISLLEDSEAVDQYSIDIVDNDIAIAADDAVEADFCAHNCRILRNRITNAFIALSSQPGLGGPTYFVRNVAYNVVHIPFKLYRGSIGDVIVHNTILKHGDGFNAYPGVPINRAFVRNNLFLGGLGGTFNGFGNGGSRVVDQQELVTANSSLDYDGYGTENASFAGRIGAVSFSGLAQLRSLTSETHAQQVTRNIFAVVPAFPSTPMTVYAAPDLSLATASNAVDTGEVIANINDDYRGTGPDLGALEAQTAPIEGLIFANQFE